MLSGKYGKIIIPYFPESMKYYYIIDSYARFPDVRYRVRNEKTSVFIANELKRILN